LCGLCFVEPVKAQTVSSSAKERSPLHTAQPFTVRDAVERVRFQYQGSQIQFSPDGRWFALVLEQGELDRKAVRSDLVVFDAEAVIAFVQGRATAPPPRTLAKFRSTSNRPAITEVRWTDQGKALVFLAENPNTLPQLHRYDLKTGRLTRLTNEPSGVWAYGYNNGGAIISVHRPPNITPMRQRESFAVHDEGLADLLDLKSLQDPSQLGVYRTLVRFGHGRWIEVPSSRQPMLATFQNAWVSPDGSRAVTLRKAARIPESWTRYSRGPGQRLKPTNDTAAISYWVMQWTLIDLRTGWSRVLIDTPIGAVLGSFAGGRAAFWRADSRSVILSDVLLPLEDSAQDHTDRQKQPYFVEVDTETGRWRTVAAFPRQNAQGAFPVAILQSRWDPARDDLLVQMISNNDKPRAVELMRLPGGAWSEREVGDSHAVRSDRSLTLEVRQSIDKTPVLLAGDARSGREAILFDPNPWFRKRTFGAASVFEFKDATGRAWRGGLVLPVGYRKGTRYPLVIQTHGFSPSEFLIQGNGTTGYAAQALANNRIAVLQLQDQDGVNNSSNEPLVYMAGYEAAIDRLAAEGIVDDSRVGIMGFSRTCLHVRYALVKSKRHFAAAVLHDGVDFGYFSFIAGYNLRPSANDSRMASYTAIWGAQPFADGLPKWLERVPSFNLHLVNAPLMIEAIGVPLFEWEWYAGLKQLGKAVEMRFVPGGSHELFRPQDQYFSQQGNVDWFVFWLKGEEDPDLLKADQYARWRKLRTLHENSTPAAKPN
jgi:dipeptidyl aminopeptidase/acylaminoacyl peptidase